MIKNRIIYVCLFVLSLIFVYFFGGKVPYVLFYTTLILPAVSFIYIFVIYFRFKYVQDIDKKFVIKGDKVNFIFSVNNEDIFLYPYIRVTFCSAETIFAKQFQVKSFSIPPFGNKSFAFELHCNYRGNYEIGIESIEIEDFLGIFKLSYKVLSPKIITVYPRIVYLDRFHLKTDYMSESHSVLNSRHEDMSTILDVRKYAYGDSLKKVHWKLTAKTGWLMVKKFQSTSETSAIILLDLKRNPYSIEENTVIEDKLIESAVSVLYYCLRNWIPVNLVYYNYEIMNIQAKNPLAFEEVYKTLAKVRFTQAVDIKDILDVYLKDNIDKTNMIIFTSNIDYEFYNQIYKTNLSGYDVSLVYISPEEITGEISPEVDNILSFLPEIGVNAYKIDINGDIKSVLERGGN